MSILTNKRVWSDYQKSVFEDISRGTGHTAVIAVAGSGKTSVIIEGFKYIPKKMRTLMISFNKSNAEDLKNKAPSYVECLTLHSLGFRAIKNAFGKAVKLNPDKTLNIITELLEAKGFKKQQKNGFDTIFSLIRTTSLCKSYLQDIPSKIDELMDSFDVDCGLLDREDFIKTICQTLRKCKEIKDFIDFDDMIYFPASFGLALGKWDYVFCDEVQDFSLAQVNMILSACRIDGRIMAVGDINQAIYSFRGADSESITNLIKRLDAKQLPLSITYRCPKSVVKLAQEFVPHLEASPTAKEGLVKEIPEKTFLDLVRPGDCVLSRINAPLIYYCMRLLRNKIPANIQGKDIGANLAWLIKKSEKKTFVDFLRWLDDWKASECVRLKAKNRDPILILDKAECLEGLCEGCKSTSEVLANIKELFTDNDEANVIICSSIHKFKGQ